jgi:hypothetical protein
LYQWMVDGHFTGKLIAGAKILIGRFSQDSQKLVE